MLRFLCLCFFFSFLPAIAPAQFGLTNVEIGYHAHLMQPAGANFIVQRYNETRTSILTREMDAFRYFDGLTLGLGMHGGAGSPYVEVGFNGRSQRQNAEGTVLGGIEQRRQLHFRHHTGYLGLGLVFGRRVVLIPGVRAEFGNVVARTRLRVDQLTEGARWERVHSHFHGYASPFCKIIIGLLAIEPYFSFTIFGDNADRGLEEVNEAINPNTYQSDPDYIPFDGGGFGLRFVFSTGGLGIR